MPTNRNAEDTRKLAKEAVRSATELVSTELGHATEELKRDATEAVSSIAMFAVAGVTGFFGLELLLLGVSGAVRHPWRSALFGVGLLAVASAAGSVGLGALPKKPLRKTSERLAEDVNAIRDELG